MQEATVANARRKTTKHKPAADETARSHDNGALDVISTLARGEISSTEAAYELRRRKLDALDLLVTIVERIAKTRDGMLSAVAVQLQRFSQQADSKPSKTIVHSVPHVPVLLNGVLYDPQDIRRFDGMALHFLAGDDQLVAIDSYPVVARLWEVSYLSSVLDSHQEGGHGAATKPQIIPAFPDTPEPEVGRPPYMLGGPAGGQTRYETALHEHADYLGFPLSLPGNRAYYDLTSIGRGFLGLGDWNDVISSVRMHGTTICVLFDHIHRGGASLTLRGSADNLERFGWNDRVSSVETW